MPKKEVSNDELATFLDTSDEWIRTRTGIASRRVLTDERVVDLALSAAEKALDSAAVPREKIGLVIATTVSMEYTTPALACLIQTQLGLNCLGFDLNDGCVGFMAALSAANAYVRSGSAEYVLIVSAEAMSRMCDWTDRSSCVLFGDAAAAVVVGAGGEDFVMQSETTSDCEVLNGFTPAGNSPFVVDPIDQKPLHMSGQEVYKFAVSHSTAGIKALLDSCQKTTGDVAWFLLHQANLRIIDAVRTRLKVDKERFPSIIDHTGNTSSASIPLLIDEMNRAGRFRPGDTVVLSAFGAGLTCASAMLTWN